MSSRLANRFCRMWVVAGKVRDSGISYITKGLLCYIIWVGQRKTDKPINIRVLKVSLKNIYDSLLQ